MEVGAILFDSRLKVDEFFEATVGKRNLLCLLFTLNLFLLRRQLELLLTRGLTQRFEVGRAVDD